MQSFTLNPLIVGSKDSIFVINFSVNVSIEVEKVNEELIGEYYKHFISLYSEKSPLLNIFLDNSMRCHLPFSLFLIT